MVGTGRVQEMTVGPTAHVTLQAQVAKVLQWWTGSSRRKPCYVGNPNWQAPLVHQILEPGKGP
jgi:hypothetical protein